MRVYMSIDINIEMLPMLQTKWKLKIVLIIIAYGAVTTECQYLIFPRLTDSSQIVAGNRAKVHVSPLGFKPKTGVLHGRLKLADPLSACTPVQEVDMANQQDTFMIADDSTCLQSVKARNLAASGAYIGLIKRNINNTLHDREVDIAHIPILELQPTDYESIIKFMAQHPDETIIVQADFSQDRSSHKKVNIQLWFSPTQVKAYEYIYEMSSFILNQEQKIKFTPHFVLHSQTSQDREYAGCFSRGRFCAAELAVDDTLNGANIVSESLRQLIIAQNRIGQWFRYASQFHQNCLKKQGETLWQDGNSLLCSENVMRSQGINAQAVFIAYNASFLGNRPQRDGNILLEEQRQYYLAEKITHSPIVLINGKSYPVATTTQNIRLTKLKICSMISPDPNQQTSECQKLTKPSLFTPAQIILGMGVMLGLMAIVMCLFKMAITRNMRRQVQGEVDKTLTQYYRYMETLNQADTYSTTGKVPLMEQKIESNQVGSVELTEVKHAQKSEQV